MANNPWSIGAQGRVPATYGTAQGAPGAVPRLPVVLNQPVLNWWTHAHRGRRAQAYAERLRAVGVDYAPQSTFARVLRPGPTATLHNSDAH